MAQEKLLRAQSQRSCIARRVRDWRKEDVKQRLFSGNCEGQFRMLASNDWPAGETWFDVAHDADTLYVSVMTLEAGNAGLLNDGFQRDSDVVEIFFDPFCDRIGFLQYMAGSEGMVAEHSHWPYRDAATHKHRDPAWEVETEEERYGVDVARFFFFRFDLETVRARDCIGFNVGRTQSRISDHSTWNLVSGIGFNDAGCFGRVWFRKPPVICANATVEIRGNMLKTVSLEGLSTTRKNVKVRARLLSPSGAVLLETRPRLVREKLVFRPASAVRLREPGRCRLLLDAATDGKKVAVEPSEFFFDHAGSRPQPFQLQGTYDFPDNVTNGVYSPEDLVNEMQWYRECGLERVYWLDYAPEVYLSRCWQGRGAMPQRVERALALCGGDFLRPAVRAAHRAGLEFITIFKPFDLPESLSFFREHPDCQIRRNPAWTREPRLPITCVLIYQGDEGRFPFTTKDIKLWQSRENRSYRAVRGSFRVRQSIVGRPEAVWSPLGAVPGPGSRRTRCLTIDGLKINAPYLAITAAGCDPRKALLNRVYRMAEVLDKDGKAVPVILTTGSMIPENGFDFGPAKSNEASWSRLDVGVERLARVQGPEIAIGLTVRQDPYLPGFLEPAHEEVRSFWLECLRRGLDADADGISIRIAHHNGCVDWLSYMYAEPVLEEFRRRTGREPEPRNDDYTLIRRIRGEFYTELLRAASAMARAAGKKFIHHIENRMLAPPEQDCYSQIYWDWRTWIKEGIVDEVDLKYIGPDHPDCYREILPLARQHGIKVNQITASPEPRTKPRSIYECRSFLERARQVGLNGINLYELWIYRRMTDRALPMTRGSGEAIIRQMRAQLDGGW